MSEHERYPGDQWETLVTQADWEAARKFGWQHDELNRLTAENQRLRAVYQELLEITQCQMFWHIHLKIKSALDQDVP